MKTTAGDAESVCRHWDCFATIYDVDDSEVDFRWPMKNPTPQILHPLRPPFFTFLKGENNNKQINTRQNLVDGGS